jgi:predicted RNA-binding protein
MCESTVYVLKNGEEQVFFEDVDSMQIIDDEIALVNIFGETQKINGKVKRFSLVEHKILLEPL